MEKGSRGRQGEMLDWTLKHWKRISWQTKTCSGMIIEAAGPQRPLWPWNSTGERRSETGGGKSMPLSLCLSSRLGGAPLSVSVFELAAARSCLPGVKQRDRMNRPHAASFCRCGAASCGAERHRVYKTKRKESETGGWKTSQKRN